MMHEQALQELSAFLDGAVEPARRRELEDHLKGCDPCRTHLEELRASVSLFKKHGRAQAPALLKTRILAKAMEPEEPAVKAVARMWKPALAWSFVAASAMFALTSVVKHSMPGLFDQTQGMISGASGSLGEGGSMGFSTSNADREESAAPAAQALEQAQFAAKAASKVDQGAQLSRAGARSHAPARAVEIGSFLGARGAAGRAGAAMAESRMEAADEAAGTVPLLRLFRDSAPFRNYWESVTSAPLPAVDFKTLMAAVLAEPPPGSRWLAAGLEAGAEGPVILYRQIPSPPQPQGAPALPPAIQLLPKTTDIVSLRKLR